MKNSLFLITLILTVSLQGQNREDNQIGSWVVLYGTNKISAQFNIINEIRFHNYALLDEVDNRFLRLGLDYRLNTRTSYTAGYVHQYSLTLTEDNVSENRLYEEVTLKDQIKCLAISHRYRIEHRWINKLGATGLYHRFRYRIQLIHPLSKALYLKMFDEIFINFQNTFFNQNRLHIGLGYAIDQNFKLEIGYLKNHLSSVHYDRLRLGITFNTDLVRKTKSK